MDEWLHIAHTMEPENVQQAKQGVSIKGLLADDSCKQSKESAFKKKDKRCIYCEEENQIDECLPYPDIKAKQNKLKSRCFIFLKKSHRTKHYQVPEKPCEHCGKKRKHHRSVRPKKFRMRSALEDQERNDQLATSTKSGMVAIGQKVVIETALVSARCSDRFYKLRDSFGKEIIRTYITEDFGIVFKVKPIEQ